MAADASPEFNGTMKDLVELAVRSSSKRIVPLSEIYDFCTKYGQKRRKNYGNSKSWEGTIRSILCRCFVRHQHGWSLPSQSPVGFRDPSASDVTSSSSSDTRTHLAGPTRPPTNQSDVEFPPPPLAGEVTTRPVPFEVKTQHAVTPAAIYRGPLDDNGRPHGHGAAYFHGIGVYAGQWRRGAAHGSGRMDYFCGERYVGEWRRGMPHGRGTMFYADGSRYEGEFREDRRHGAGTFVWPKEAQTRNTHNVQSDMGGQSVDTSDRGCRNMATRYGTRQVACDNAVNGCTLDSECEHDNKPDQSEGTRVKQRYHCGILVHENVVEMPADAPVVVPESSELEESEGTPRPLTSDEEEEESFLTFLRECHSQSEIARSPQPRNISSKKRKREQCETTTAELDQLKEELARMKRQALQRKFNVSQAIDQLQDAVVQLSQRVSAEIAALRDLITTCMHNDRWCQAITARPTAEPGTETARVMRIQYIS